MDDEDEEIALADPVTRAEGEESDDDMKEQQKRERGREDDQGEEEEFAARAAERCIAPVSPVGLLWLDSRTSA
eukprot:13984012-Heterocapsa_arctica.AAC.1